MLLVIVLVAALVLSLGLLLVLGGQGSPRVLAATTAVLGISGLLLLLAFWFLQLDLENDAVLLWVWVCGSSVFAGGVNARLGRKLALRELFGAGTLVLIGAALLLLLVTDDIGLTAPPVRMLLVAPPALLLCLAFGASLGLLLFGAGGRRDLRLGYEAMVARRFLLSKSSPVLSTVTTLSVMGVAVGVWLVISALGVLAGFEGDLQRKIIGTNAHVAIHEESHQPFAIDADLLGHVAGVPGVTAVSPVVEGHAAVGSQSNFVAAQVFGIDPRRAREVLGVFDGLEGGSLQPLVDEMKPPQPSGDRPEEEAAGEFAPPAPMPGVVIGVEMAKSLNVTIGDCVRMVSPLHEVITPLGVAPRSQGFRVVATFSSKMYEFDARYAYVSLPAMRRFAELEEDQVGVLHLRTADPERSDRVARAAVAALGEGRFEALDWKQRNQTLFSALKLERMVAFVVLAFIILVASFSIVTTLSMSVIEKRREIAILMTMGARRVGVMKLFLVQGLLVGGFGTIIGMGFGIGTVLALKRFGFSIPVEVYYIDSLPVRLAPLDVVLVAVAALLIVWVFAVFPALQGANLEPVEGIRDG